MRAVAAVMAVAVMALAACSSTEAPVAADDLPREIAGKLTADDMYTHLRKLQEIADANRGNRAQGTPGYDATVDYVAKVLKDNGFDVSTPEFDRLERTEGGNPTLTVSGRRFQADQASLLVGTPAGGLNAITLRPQRAPGCSAADYGTVSVQGAIAVVDDTACSVVAKQDAAVAKGAVGLLVVSAPASTGPAGLFTPGYYQKLTIPVGVVGRDADAALRRTNAPVRLVLDSKPVMAKARNVVAQTKAGDTKNVVLAGARLDSSPRSPGINDDGSGVAALLSTASAMGAAPKIANAVRFAFWGADEEGPTKYVGGLSRDGLNDIALYLGVGAIGSPNAGYFTYDGDQSGTLNPDIPPQSVPAGSAGVERMLAGHLNLAGVRPADMPLSRTADYAAFMAAGIPIGGVSTGWSQRKSEVQARLWGGQAGVAFDPNWRTARDNIDNIDRDALSVMGKALAYSIGSYAQQTDGVNGVPPRDQRHRSTP
ncbi:peptidase M28 [Mycobacterium sp. ACS1612]|uniref:M28 family peptidase n=1 Tax=Mycobacterium sp. ACS1612 TaxID=1834117 RepID=UPI0007FC863D|nr:M28 family peptidase [Mycobacterium sp. ACS1612]OBF31527.1 peptidase M28 [Mycobacterium sp. ACS1612]